VLGPAAQEVIPRSDTDRNAPKCNWLLNTKPPNRSQMPVRRSPADRPTGPTICIDFQEGAQVNGFDGRAVLITGAASGIGF